MVVITAELRDKIVAGKVQLFVNTGDVSGAWNGTRQALKAHPEWEVIGIDFSNALFSSPSNPLSMPGAQPRQQIVLSIITIMYIDSKPKNTNGHEPHEIPCT